MAVCRPVSVTLVAVGAGDAFDELVGAEPAQVVGDLAGGDGGQAAELGGEVAQVAVGEAAGQEPEDQQGGEQGLDAGLGEAAGRGCGCRCR